ETGAVRTHLVHPPDHLVPRHRLRATRCEVALRQVQVGAAHPAGLHPHPDLTRTRYRFGTVDEAQRTVRDRSRLVDDPALHRVLLPSDGPVRLVSRAWCGLTAPDQGLSSLLRPGRAGRRRLQAVLPGPTLVKVRRYSDGGTP